MGVFACDTIAVPVSCPFALAHIDIVSYSPCQLSEAGMGWLDYGHRVSHWFFATTQEYEHIGIDCYAACSPGEFFAALNEVFLERPDVVKKPYPEIYEQFCHYYRQDPLQRVD